jgi:hypothetical protein
MSQLQSGEYINILTYNVCWEAIWGQQTLLGQKCANATKSTDKVPTVCSQNIAQNIDTIANNNQYDFVALQEISSNGKNNGNKMLWKDLINHSNKLQSMGYLHNINSPQTSIITFFNKEKYVPKYFAYGDIGCKDDKGRSCQIIGFELISQQDISSNRDLYIVINLHAPHRNIRSLDCNKIQNILYDLRILPDPFLNEFEKLDKINLNKHVLNELEQYYNIFGIMAGDFNDENENRQYWQKGLNYKLNINQQNYIDLNFSTNSNDPPLSCCDSKGSKTYNRISDYVLVTNNLHNNKNIYNQLGLQKSTIASDHAPVFMQINQPEPLVSSQPRIIGYDFDGVLHKTIIPYTLDDNTYVGPLALQRHPGKLRPWNLNNLQNNNELYATNRDPFNIVIDRIKQQLQNNDTVHIISSGHKKNVIDKFLQNHFHDKSNQINVHINIKDKIDKIIELGITEFSDDSWKHIQEIYKNKKSEIINETFMLYLSIPTEFNDPLNNTTFSIQPNLYRITYDVFTYIEERINNLQIDIQINIQIAYDILRELIQDGKLKPIDNSQPRSRHVAWESRTRGQPSRRVIVGPRTSNRHGTTTKRPKTEKPYELVTTGKIIQNKKVPSKSMQQITTNSDNHHDNNKKDYGTELVVGTMVTIGTLATALLFL